MPRDEGFEKLATSHLVVGAGRAVRVSEWLNSCLGLQFGRDMGSGNPFPENPKPSTQTA